MYELTADDLQMLAADVAEPLTKVVTTLVGACQSFIERAEPGTSANMMSADRPDFEHDHEMREAVVHIGSALDLLAAFVPPDGPAFRAYLDSPLAAVGAARSESRAAGGTISDQAVIITLLIEALKANAIAAQVSAKDANAANAEAAAAFATAAKELAQAVHTIGK
jgi:hypothetical protein